MAKSGRNKRDLVLSLSEELTKEHSEYDGNDRLVSLYQAVNDTTHGGFALLTRYTYVGVTNLVENMDETESTWDSSWDIP